MPEYYAERFSPLTKTSEVFRQGESLYKVHCLECHGQTGAGDGPMAKALTPKPANISVGGYIDNYVFWRVTEGGNVQPFCSSMPSFFEVMPERDRWAVSAYVTLMGNLEALPSSDAGAETDTTPAAPPTLKSVAPMAGALHVTWSLSTRCDGINLERSKDGEPFRVAFRLIGLATDQHDTQIAPPGKFCYRAICEKRGALSAPSNELCGTL